MKKNELYECEICKKSFNHGTTLMKHNRNIHKMKQKEISQCDKCKKIFFSKKELERHANI